MAGSEFPRDTEERTPQAGALRAATLPLTAGLRGMAQESSNRRVAKALHQLVEEVEKGRPLKDALAAAALPAHVRGLVQAVIRTGDVGRALVDLADQTQQARRRKQMVASALAYPLLLAALLLGLFVFFALVVVPPFGELIADFGLELPPATQVMLWWSEVGVWGLLALLAAFAIAVVVGPWVVGQARWRRLIGTIPLLGPIWQWSGAAELCRLLELLVRQDVPLSEALRLAADGVRDPNVADASRQLAADIERGWSFSSWLATSGRLPACITPLVAWGEAAEALPEALRTAAEVLERRIELRALLLKAVMPPIMFLAVLGGALHLLSSLFEPLVGLIQGLSFINAVW